MNPEQTSPGTGAAGRPYYPALDGLRGLAILLVLVYHNFGFIDYFFFGWLGVDLFFVLSGFLITDILLKTLGQKNYLRNFYARRVLRIFPLYYLTLIIFLLILPRFVHAPDLGYYTDHQVWLWTYMQNWLYIFKPDDSTNILHHFWSLAVEEQFYILWPLTILLIKKPVRLLVLLGAVLLAVIALRLVVWTYQIENLAYFNLYTFSRIDGICIGSMLALLQVIRPDFLKKNLLFIVLGLAGVNFIFYFFNESRSFSLPYLAIAGYTTFAVMLALLVYEAVRGENRIVLFIFRNLFMRFFGKISYGLYVFHWPLYLFLETPLKRMTADLPGVLPQAIVVSVIATLLAIGLSWISFRYFESIFTRKKVYFDG